MFRRIGTVLTGALLATAALTVPSFAVDPTTANEALSPAISEGKTQLLVVVATVALAAIVFLVVRKGWKFVRSMI